MVDIEFCLFPGWGRPHNRPRRPGDVRDDRLVRSCSNGGGSEHRTPHKWSADAKSAGVLRSGDRTPSGGQQRHSNCNRPDHRQTTLRPVERTDRPESRRQQGEHLRGVVDIGFRLLPGFDRLDDRSCRPRDVRNDRLIRRGCDDGGTKHRTPFEWQADTESASGFRPEYRDGATTG